MDTVVIAGVGLIGGSFAKALKQHGIAQRILGIDRPEVLAEALELGIIDEPAAWDESVSRADLLYLAAPISGIMELLPVADALARPGALITDTGSTKVEICRAASRLAGRGCFIGGHPMAGKEIQGCSAADAALFEGKPYFLTPAAGQEQSASLQVLTQVLSTIGARTRVISAEAHDETVAFVSHLPQLMSTALAELLGRIPGMESAAGPGAVDMTRLAGSSYQLWSGILDTNVDAIRLALAEYVRQLSRIEAALGHPEMKKHFEDARKFARLLHKK
ncbi:MAG: prephenate dehydrogenase/arogenate dehydrogenase family protein [Bryobacteraceae bacterium]|nr:prephenate dehydrogenase/arogenate dehydrogenase family protein [Bryobacteraceae bacterium]